MEVGGPGLVGDSFFFFWLVILYVIKKLGFYLTLLVVVSTSRLPYASGMATITPGIKPDFQVGSRRD